MLNGLEVTHLRFEVRYRNTDRRLIDAPAGLRLAFAECATPTATRRRQLSVHQP